MTFSSSSSSTSQLLLIRLLISAILCGAAFSQHDGVVAEDSCSDDFKRLMKSRGNMTNCKSLRTLGAQFGWNIVQERNGTNGSSRFFDLDVMFGASLLVGPPAWIAWGVNPEKRPEMIGTKAIVGIIPASDNSGMEVRTYEITKETRLGCRLEPTEDLWGVQVRKESKPTIAYDQASHLYTISATLRFNQ